MGQACSLEKGPCSVFLPAGTRLEIPDLSEETFNSRYVAGKQLAPKVCQVKNKVDGKVHVAYRLGKELHPCRDGELLSKHIKSLKSFDHPSSCKLLEAFDAGRITMLVYSQLDGKKILETLSKKKNLSEIQVRDHLLQLVRGIQAGLERGFHHGAICPKNIFVNSSAKTIFTDLGLAGHLKPMPVMSCTSTDTMEYMPPEALAVWPEAQKYLAAKKPTALRGLLQQKLNSGSQANAKLTEEEEAELTDKFYRTTINEKSDVYSVGAVMHALLVGSPPFKGKDLKSLSVAISEGKLEIPKKAKLSAVCTELLNRMLHKDPSKRPTLAELLKDPWFGAEEENGGASSMILDEALALQLGTLHAETHFKKFMMRLVSSKVPSRKIKDLKAAFKTLDANKDGQVSLEEFKAGIGKTGLLDEGSLVDAQSAFSEIDYNHSGGISVEEFLAATIDSQQEVLEAAMWDAFKAVDTDGDGRLDHDELERVVHNMDQALGQEHIEMMMHLLEHEVDGPMSFNEFKDLLFQEGGRHDSVVGLQGEMKSEGMPICAKMRRKARQVIDARPCRSVEKKAQGAQQIQAKLESQPDSKPKPKAKRKAS
mmetsp:Transcript_1125/g.2285  ORF Transcript_1125/g.2285 Transcript_1125/m.2285 type:complete len:594 (-) Transcript_1125:195-1976(-)|eukprot:CAMPEP_0197634374 /NCGR_PEP_ID=MMETSP1338-20131121/10484_1 /TAXON_ID=43686 ORGANISM="Pelagodinium beii, Strain RCC1491" /NCGR_SAMPLE_ID=MMETSP1338 /ASSEMBLY_ACC=CAM_ASM_000754 /LENGTH=593 /DNA_ID=CAMNT_0043206227 /DNA_START=92 /DNA_END=1873 /DNA_ORIENTATION=-